MFWFASRVEYHTVSSSSEKECNRDDESIGSVTLHEVHTSWKLKIAVAINLLLFVISTIAVLALVRLSSQNAILNADLRRANAYSPLYEMLDLEPRVKTTNGTLFPPKDRSISRQMPNKNADAVWGEWEITRIFPVTREQISKMGKDPSTVVQLKDEIWGLGDNAYASMLDVYHHLHCVNTLRKVAYGTYYNRTQVDPYHEGLTEIHLNHCVDMLVQFIQCTGNVNLATLHWVETQEYPVVDMSVNRKCANFDALTEWRRDNTLPIKTWLDHMESPPADAKVLPMVEMYWDFFPEEKKEHNMHGTESSIL